MFTYGLNKAEQTNRTGHRFYQRAQLTSPVIDDKVSPNVLKCASGQIHQSQAETQINTISSLFTLLAAFFVSNDQTWQDISFCNLKGGGEFMPPVECDQN